MTRTSPLPTNAAGGASLVDALVGLAVGLLSIVVVYQAFVAIDTVRRSAAAVADAQSAGAFALHAMAAQIGNAGAGTAASARWLDTCPVSTDAAASLRPFAALITDGGAPDRPDALVLRQALAPVAATPVAFAEPAPAGVSFRAEGFDVFAVGDRIAAISRTGACVTARVTALSAAAPGIVEIAHTPVAIDLPVTSVLLNLGPAARASTLRYDVAGGVLRSTDLTNADAPVPLVSNVVNLKLQFGIDSDGDGLLDTWLGAGAADGFGATALLAAPRATLDRIKAVRIGLVIRSDRLEPALTGAFHWVLFDCDLVDKSACPGRLEGTIAASPSGGYRYLTFETIVPLRNVIWNTGA